MNVIENDWSKEVYYTKASIDVDKQLWLELILRSISLIKRSYIMLFYLLLYLKRENGSK